MSHRSVPWAPAHTLLLHHLYLTYFFTQTLFCLHYFQKTIPDGLSRAELGRFFFYMYFYHILMFYNQIINSRTAETIFSLRVAALNKKPSSFILSFRFWSLENIHAEKRLLHEDLFICFNNAIKCPSHQTPTAGTVLKCVACIWVELVSFSC